MIQWPILWLAAQRDPLELIEDLLEKLGVGIAFRKGKPDFSHTDFDLSTDLEQLQANRSALSLGQLGPFQSQTSQRLDHHIGK